MTTPHPGIPSTWKSERRDVNCRLSQHMKAALIESVDGGRIRSETVGTLKALAARDLCDPQGTLTPFGHVTAVSLLPLAEQCRVLGLALEEHQLLWHGHPEPAAIALLSPRPQWAFADEGRMLHALIHALVLPRLYAMASAAWNKTAGYDRARSWLYGHYAAYRELLEIEPELVDAMLHDIRRWDKALFMRSWQRLGKWNRGVSSHPAACVSPEEALTVLDGVGKSTLFAIAARVFSEPYAYYSGWPDIMMLDSANNLRFVEVKTMDTLHYGQIITMTDMKEAANLDIRVLRLARSGPRSRKASRDIV